MGTLLLNQIKRQASSFLQEKYKGARLALTDVTQAELLAEEVTNNDPCSPDAKSMTRIAEASFEFDDFWRIVDVLHRRLYGIDWKLWRQSYKSLVLLEFLLTHGPEDFAEEFQSDAEIIEELGTFKHIDGKGFDWGANMQKKSDQIVKLLGGGETLKAARLKALKITKEIQGFGNLMLSPTSPSSSSPSSEASRTSSFGSYSSSSSTFNDLNHDLTKLTIGTPNYSDGGIRDDNKAIDFGASNEDVGGTHLWECSPIEEKGCLIDYEDEDEDEEKSDGFVSGIFGEKKNGLLKSFSDVGRVMKKKIDRQFSMGY